MTDHTNLTKKRGVVRTNPKWRVYEVRAACASLGLNSGRVPAIISAEIVHSVEILFERHLGPTANNASGGLGEIEERLKQS